MRLKELVTRPARKPRSCASPRVPTPTRSRPSKRLRVTPSKTNIRTAPPPKFYRKRHPPRRMSMTEKPTEPTKRANKPTGSRKPTTRRRKPSHDEISERAYFIHLEAGERDQLGNWLRAERELAAA